MADDSKSTSSTSKAKRAPARQRRTSRSARVQQAQFSHDAMPLEKTPGAADPTRAGRSSRSK